MTPITQLALAFCAGLLLSSAGFAVILVRQLRASSNEYREGYAAGRATARRELGDRCLMQPPNPIFSHRRNVRRVVE